MGEFFTISEEEYDTICSTMSLLKNDKEFCFGACPHLTVKAGITSHVSNQDYVRRKYQRSKCVSDLKWSEIIKMNVIKFNMI